MPSAFKDYLTQKALIKDKYVPFYLKWVSDCYSFLNEPASKVLNSEQMSRFHKYLAKTHEDWQVKQASQGLLGFRPHFLFYFINDKLAE
ncbi:MAG: hypothetical protein FJ266_12710 [Planctomycetes bacterium]|nr:hypothetical protein [Planctomycetota bacterium]